MKKRRNMACILALVLVTNGILLFAADTNQWNVQVTRLVVALPTTAIVKANLGNKIVSEKLLRLLRNTENYTKHNDESSGVMVRLRITAPQGQVVGSYFSEATVTSFMDDKGKNLLTDDGDESRLRPAEGITETGYSNGSSFMWLEVKSSQLPSKGATELKLVGKVVVKTASRNNQFVAKDVNLDTGSKFDLGDLQVTVSDVRVKDERFIMTLDANRDLTAIASLEVFDQKGKQIDAHLSESADIHDTNKHIVTFSERVLTLENHLDNATIKATCWTDLETTEVPINAKIGLGL